MMRLVFDFLVALDDHTRGLIVLVVISALVTLGAGFGALVVVLLFGRVDTADDDAMAAPFGDMPHVRRPQ